MKNFWQYTSIALAVVVFILCSLLSCEHGKRMKLQKGCDQKLTKSDTVTIRDTVKIAFSTPVYIPKPYRIDIETPVPVYMDTGDHTPVDTAAILKDYYASIYYHDSQRVMDSAGNIVGEVMIHDQISRNRIKQRQVFGSIQKETVTQTITNTIEAKKKNQLFLGMTGNYATYNKQLFPSASLLVVFKRGFGVETGAGILNDRTFYTASFKLNLSSKK